MQKNIYHTEISHIGLRLDAFLASQIDGMSREKIKRAIQDGHCNINSLQERSPAVRLKLGQQIELFFGDCHEHIEVQAGELDIIWNDEHILICNKPAGITVHPCPSCPTNTYIQRLAAKFPKLLEQEGLRPGIVHRLDKDTSGLMVVALSEAARLQLSEAFAKRQVQKSYLALVHGVPPDRGEITLPIGRHPNIKVKMAVVDEKHGGRQAHSAWEVLYADPQKRFALVKVSIFTGRTHQIRVHMAELGFALIGDNVYGASVASNNSAKRHMLHAWKLSFIHPANQEELNFCTPPPKDMLDCATSFAKNLQKIVIVGLPGSGKSTLLDEFSQLGMPIWSADEVVKKLYKPGEKGHKYFQQRFDTRFVAHKMAEIDRDALREAMRDSNTRKEINNYIHTLVYDDLQIFWENCIKEGHQFAVAEIPLYLENGRHHAEDVYIIGVKCPQETRYARLKTNRRWTDEQCQSIDSWQWSEEKKFSICNIIVDNTQDINISHNKAKNILNELKSKANEKEIELAKYLQNLW